MDIKMRRDALRGRKSKAGGGKKIKSDSIIYTPERNRNRNRKRNRKREKRKREKGKRKRENEREKINQPVTSEYFTLSKSNCYNSQIFPCALTVYSCPWFVFMESSKELEPGSQRKQYDTMYCMENNKVK